MLLAYFWAINSELERGSLSSLTQSQKSGQSSPSNSQTDFAAYDEKNVERTKYVILRKIMHHDSSFEDCDLAFAYLSNHKIPAWLHYAPNDERLVVCLRAFWKLDNLTQTERLIECLKVYQGELQLAKLMTEIMKITYLHQSISDLIGQYHGFFEEPIMLDNLDDIYHANDSNHLCLIRDKSSITVVAHNPKSRRRHLMVISNTQDIFELYPNTKRQYLTDLYMARYGILQTLNFWEVQIKINIDKLSSQINPRVNSDVM
jgi:hypothetical protein